MWKEEKKNHSQLCFAVGYPSGCKEETRFDGDVHAIDLKKLLGRGSCWQQTEKKRTKQPNNHKKGSGGEKWRKELVRKKNGEKSQNFQTHCLMIKFPLCRTCSRAHPGLKCFSKRSRQETLMISANSSS